MKIYSKNYNLDGRIRIDKIYSGFEKLSKGWIRELIDTHNLNCSRKEVSFPIYSYRTSKKGKSIWILSGVHGEEPAGPMALLKNISLFEKLKKQGFSLVIIPLINPTGYFRNYRYLFHYKDWAIGKSMGDCESFLLDYQNKPRENKPSSDYGTPRNRNESHR